MKIGVTGTRSGMNEYQYSNIQDFLKTMFLGGFTELHHGDCVGVDVEVACMAKELGYKIVCHPPISNDLRGNFSSDITHEPMTYFARNRQIVNQSDVLMVVPYQNSHQTTGGTWYTHDYAVKQSVPVSIFYPKESNES